MIRFRVSPALAVLAIMVSAPATVSEAQAGQKHDRVAAPGATQLCLVSAEALVPRRNIQIAQARSGNLAGVTGRNVKDVAFGLRGRRMGTFVEKKSRQWQQVPARRKNKTYTFVETGRDNWSVYLFDRSRNLRIQIDLRGKRVMDVSRRRKLYDIQGATAKSVRLQPTIREKARQARKTGQRKAPVLRRRIQTDNFGGKRPSGTKHPPPSAQPREEPQSKVLQDLADRAAQRGLDLKRLKLELEELRGTAGSDLPHHDDGGGHASRTADPTIRTAPDGGGPGDAIYTFVNNSPFPVDVVHDDGRRFVLMFSLEPHHEQQQFTRPGAKWGFGLNEEIIREHRISQGDGSRIFAVVDGHPPRHASQPRESNAYESPDGARPNDVEFIFVNNSRAPVDVLYQQGGKYVLMYPLEPNREQRQLSRPGARWGFGQNDHIIRVHEIQRGERGRIYAMMADNRPAGRPSPVQTASVPKSGPEVSTTPPTSPMCWKDSYGRGVGEVPGRLADCPRTYTNNGATCGRGSHDIHTSSRLAICPSGYSNTGSSCYRGPHSYSVTYRLADCPRGFKNMLTYCGKGTLFDIATRSIGSAKCKRGTEFKKGAYCYKTCKSGYTNLSSTCHRTAHTLGLGAASCPSGYFKGAVFSRCSKKCPAGYTSTGDTCHKAVSTLLMNKMTCKRGEVRRGARCYPAGRGLCGSNKQEQLALCYTKCSSGYEGVGPVCWSTRCPSKYPYECGAGCAVDGAACLASVLNQTLSSIDVLSNVAILAGTAGSGSAAIAASGTIKAALKKGATKVAQKALQSVVKKELKRAGKRMGRELAEEALINASLMVVDAAQHEDFDYTLLDPTGIAGLVEAFNQPLCADVR